MLHKITKIGTTGQWWRPLKNNESSPKGFRFLTAIILMCMCLLTVSIKAEVKTDKNSYPQGETVIATASVSSSVYYTVFYLKNSTVSGSTALQNSGNIYKYNTTTPKATFSTSTLTAGTYYVYAVTYNSSGSIIANNDYKQITVTNSENYVSSTPATSNTNINFTRVSGKYIFLNAPEQLKKKHLGDFDYGNKYLYRGNISGTTRVYAEFNNETDKNDYGNYIGGGINISFGYCFWNGNSTTTTVTIQKQGTSIGWGGRSSDTWEKWFNGTGAPFTLSIPPQSAKWIYVGSTGFVTNSSSAYSFPPSETFDCALEIVPSATIQIEAVAYNNFAHVNGTFTNILELNNDTGSGVSNYNAVTGNLSWTIGNDLANGSVLPVQSISGRTDGEEKGCWRTNHQGGDGVQANPEMLPLTMAGGGITTAFCNFGVIYTETLTFTNNSNSDKILEYYIKVPQTYNSAGEWTRSYSINLPNEQQFLAYNFMAPCINGNYCNSYNYTYGWDSYGGDYQNIQSAQSVSRFVKKISVPRNSTISTIVEYVLGGQSNQRLGHFIKVVASSNFTQNPTTYTINTSSSPSAGGTTSGGGTKTSGSSCTVTASANSNYTFTNWTENGSVVSSSASYTFTVTTNRNLVANFTQNPTTYTISTSSSPSTGGTTSGGGTKTSGSSCTVSATANSNYIFTNWTENGSVVSSSASYTFTVTTNRNLVANFTGTCKPIPEYDYSLTPTTSWQTATSNSIQSNGCKIYRFSATQGEKYSFKTGCGDGATANFDTYLEIFDGNVTKRGYNDDACSTAQSHIENWECTSSTGGNGNYYLKVRGYDSSDYGSYTLAYKKTISAPTNDLCTNAITLSCGVSVTGTVTGATKTTTVNYGNDTNGNNVSDKNDVFYKFTAQISGIHNITFNSTSDIDLGLYQSCTSTARLASLYFNGTMSYNCTAGQTYIIRVYDWDGAGGTFTIKLDCPSTYTVTYNYNGATGGNTEANKQVTYNSAYGTLPSPTKQYTVTYNYNGSGQTNGSGTYSATFGGWYKEAAFTNQVTSATTVTTASNHTIYAKWTDGTALTLPTPNARTGYTFNGWYTAASGGTKIGNGGATYTPTAAITLYAQWTPIPPANDLCSNATTLSCGTTVSGTMAGSTPTTSISYARDPYYNDVFYKFTTTNAGTYTLTLTKSKLSDDIDLTLFTNSCSATNHLAEMGANGMTEIMSYNCSANTTYIVRANEGAGIASGSFTIKLDCPYTITYNYNGATGGNTEPNKQVTYNSTYGTLPSPTKQYTVTYNYNGSGQTNGSGTYSATFGGWYKEAAFTNQVTSTTTVTTASNHTIYAKWADGTALTLPTPNARTGYTFNGWYTATSGGTKIGNGGATYTPTAAITLYAQWTPIPPANDLCSNATNLSCGTTVSGTMAGATPTTSIDYGNAYNGTYNGNKKDVFYKFTTTNAGTYIVTLTSSDDIDLELYSGCNTDAEIAYDFDTGTMSCSNLSANTTYYIRCIDWNGTGGSFNIKVDCPQTYTVTYNYNGATGGNTEANKQVTYNSAYGTLPSPTKQYTVTYNYNGSGQTNGSGTYSATFGGWYKEAAFTNQVTSTTTITTASNHTIYAKWTDGTALTLPTPNARTGYTFAGWYTAASGGTKVGNSGATYIPTATITLYAQWTTNPVYTITLNAQGGSVSPSSITVPYGAQVGTLPTPNRDGYTFGGWFTGTNGSGTQYTATTVYNTSGNTTLYAKWTAITYTVTYNGNGNTGGSTASSSHTYDVAKALTSNSFTRAYTVTYNYNGNGASNTTATATYTFKNWNRESNGGGTSYTNGQSVTNLTSTNGVTVHLYAQWNSGSVNLPAPTRTGYLLAGWYTAASGGTRIGSGGASYTPTAAITLYAQWTPIGGTTDNGVIINGVKWATRNVDRTGTFAANPESTGWFYQWNRKTGWSPTNPMVNSNGGTTWDSSIPTGSSWIEVNDPSPADWRVPTLDEIEKLFDTGKVSNEWTTQNGIIGRKFTDKTTGNSLFLPAAGDRGDGFDGTLRNVGTKGYYWSSTQYNGDGAYNLLFLSNYTVWNDISGRNSALSIRAVAKNFSNAISIIENTVVKIYPNPTKSEIFIKSDLPIEKIEICSLTGILLILENNFAEKISVSGLPRGVYLLKVYTDKGLVISKVVKE